tara:strand:+ start:499 stop:1965 length:1467 start_codon:yes stop_codon:yes gene_type:complete
MADEIYINTGSTFQQPYQGQVPANGQEPNIRSISGTYPANAQSPFTYQNRTPFTYQDQKQARQPVIYDHRSPFTYNRDGQSPFTYQHPYIANARQPFTYQVQSPFTYNRQGQSPFTYQNRQPVIYSYQANAQQPNIRQRSYTDVNVSKQSSFTYDAQRVIQEPHIGNRQTAVQGPYITQSQEPNAWYEPELFSWMNYRSPIAGQAQGPYITPQTYAFQANASNVQSPYNTPVSSRSPYTFTGQAHGTVYNPFIGEPFPYRYPVINQPNQQPVSSQQPARQPNIQLSNVGSARQPYRAPARQPVIYQHTRQVSYDHRVPFTYPVAQVNKQSPYIADAQQPYPYIAVGQENNSRNAQNPFTYQNRQPSNAQQPYPYIANAQQPNSRSKQSPFTYPHPVDAQQPYIAQGRSPSTYQSGYTYTYDHRSPFTYQQPYSTTRPIGPLAKVKGVFINEGGTLRKADEIYANAPQGPQGTNVEKIHQSVPDAQFLK